MRKESKDCGTALARREFVKGLNLLALSVSCGLLEFARSDRQARAAVLGVVLAVLSVAGAIMQLTRKSSASPIVPLLLDIQSSLGVLHQRLDTIESTLEQILKKIDVLPNEFRILLEDGLDKAFGAQLKGVIDTFVEEVQHYELSPTVARRQKLEDYVTRIREARNTLFVRSNLNCLSFFYAAHAEIAAARYLEYSAAALDVTLNAFDRRFSELLRPQNGTGLRDDYIDVLLRDASTQLHREIDTFSSRFGLVEKERKLLRENYYYAGAAGLEDRSSSILKAEGLLYGRYVSWEVSKPWKDAYVSPTLGEFHDPTAWHPGEPLFSHLETIKWVRDLLVDLDIRPVVIEDIFTYEVSIKRKIVTHTNKIKPDGTLAYRNVMDVLKIKSPSPRYDQFVRMGEEYFSDQATKMKYAAREVRVGEVSPGVIYIVKPGTQGTPGSGGSEMQVNQASIAGQLEGVPSFKLFSSTGRQSWASPENEQIVLDEIDKDIRFIDGRVPVLNQLVSTAASLAAMNDALYDTWEYFQTEQENWKY